MKVINLKNQQLNRCEPLCAAIGFFDGLHRGHMALIEEVKHVAESKGYKKAVITFDHHPLYVLGHIKEEKHLTAMEDRIRLLEKEGIDYLLVIPFDHDLANLTSHDFINRYLIAAHIQHIVCGFDFRFGKDNQGTIETLEATSAFTVSVIPEIIFENEKISSTRIRKDLIAGHVNHMVPLLGRHYCLCGKVVHGQKMGRQLGFPTANIDYQDYVLPARGVYAVKVIVQGQTYNGMCNIGFNPTLSLLNKTSLEVHILDFSSDIYGEIISVVFYQMLRQEKQFSSLETLKEQLQRDKEETYLYFRV